MMQGPVCPSQLGNRKLRRRGASRTTRMMVNSIMATWTTILACASLLTLGVSNLADAATAIIPSPGHLYHVVEDAVSLSAPEQAHNSVDEAIVTAEMLTKRNKSAPQSQTTFSSNQIEEYVESHTSSQHGRRLEGINMDDFKVQNSLSTATLGNPLKQRNFALVQEQPSSSVVSEAEVGPMSVADASMQLSDTRQVQANNGDALPKVNVDGLYDYTNIGTGLEIGDQGRYSHGNVFDIETKDDPIVITSLTVTTQKPLAAGPSAAIVIYTKSGSYTDNDRLDRGNWKLLATTPLVLLDSPVESEQWSTYTCGMESDCLTPLYVPKESTQTILILMASVDVAYTEHPDHDLSKPWVEDRKVSVYMGAGIGIFPVIFSQEEDYKQFFTNRLWHGELTYALMNEITESPSISPSALPSVAPSPRPTSHPTAAEVPESVNIKRLESPLGGSSTAQGVMFDVSANFMRNVVLRGLMLSTAEGLSEDQLKTIEVYHSSQPHVGIEQDADQWKKLEAAFVMKEEKQSDGQTLYMVELKINPVIVNSGQTNALYVTFSDTLTELMISDAGSLQEGSILAEDLDVRILVGSVVEYPFGPTSTTPASINGVVIYSTPTDAPTSSPTSQPTLMVGLLETQTKLSIKGLSRRRLRELSTLDDEATRRYYEKVGRKFLSRTVNGKGGPPINISHFIVSPNIEIIDTSRVSKSRWPLADLVNRFLQSDEEEGPTLDVYQTILGEYSPPPVVDFSAIVEMSFEDSGDELLEELKESEEIGVVFQEARSVKAEVVSFPKPPEILEAIAELTAPEPEPEPEGNPWLVYVWIGCVAAVLLTAITAFLLVRRRKKKKAQRELDEENEAEQFVNGYGDANPRRDNYGVLAKQGTTHTMDTDAKYSVGYDSGVGPYYDEGRSYADPGYASYKQQALEQSDLHDDPNDPRGFYPQEAAAPQDSYAAYKAQVMQMQDQEDSRARSFPPLDQHQPQPSYGYPEDEKVRDGSAPFAHPEVHGTTPVQAFAVSPASFAQDHQQLPPAQGHDGQSQVSAQSSRRLRRSIPSPSPHNPYNSGAAGAGASGPPAPAMSVGSVSQASSATPNMIYESSRQFRFGDSDDASSALSPRGGGFESSFRTNSTLETAPSMQSPSQRSVPSAAMSSEDKTVKAILFDASLTQTGKLQLVQQIPNLSARREAIVQDAALTKTQKLRQLQMHTTSNSPVESVDGELLLINGGVSAPAPTPISAPSPVPASVAANERKEGVIEGDGGVGENATPAASSFDPQERQHMIQAVLRHPTMTEPDKREQIKQIIDGTAPSGI